MLSSLPFLVINSDIMPDEISMCEYILISISPSLFLFHLIHPFCYPQIFTPTYTKTIIIIIIIRALRLKKDPVTLDSLGVLFLRQSKLHLARHVYEHIWAKYCNRTTNIFEIQQQRQQQMMNNIITPQIQNKRNNSEKGSENLEVREKKEEKQKRVEGNNKYNCKKTSNKGQELVATATIHIHYVSNLLLLLSFSIEY